MLSRNLVTEIRTVIHTRILNKAMHVKINLNKDICILLSFLKHHK